MATLVLELTCTYSGAIGYGDLLACRVHRVVRGDLDADELTMVVLAGEEAIGDRLVQAGEEKPVTVVFEKESEDEARSLPPVTGFVDMNRTAWRIREVIEGAL